MDMGHGVPGDKGVSPDSEIPVLYYIELGAKNCRKRKNLLPLP